MSVLSNYIRGYAAKIIKRVDLPDEGSNQHELGGVAKLKEMFESDSPVRGTVNWIRFDDQDETREVLGEFYYYDPRAKSASRTGRSEWRLYYYEDRHVLDESEVGDLLVLIRLKESPKTLIHAFVFSKDSTWFDKASLLFESSGNFVVVDERSVSTKKLGFAEEYILSLLGIETKKLSPQIEDLVEEHLPSAKLPTTKKMAELVHTLLPFGRDHDLDDQLLQWLRFEEQLFMAWERREVQKRLDIGFTGSTAVDDFIKYSLSVQNTRKSRMGYSLENHLEKIFLIQDIKFQKKAETENGNEPDFLFPSHKDYLNLSFPSDLLSMLGAKSSLKERWRQILPEADRITEKHLCTLEPKISVKQTDQMVGKKVRLVIPTEIHSTYTSHQLRQILSVTDFSKLVLERQASVSLLKNRQA
jgi:hypothetical protein